MNDVIANARKFGVDVIDYPSHLLVGLKKEQLPGMGRFAVVPMSYRDLEQPPSPQMVRYVNGVLDTMLGIPWHSPGSRFL